MANITTTNKRALDAARFNSALCKELASMTDEQLNGVKVTFIVTDGGDCDNNVIMVTGVDSRLGGCHFFKVVKGGQTAKANFTYNSRKYGLATVSVDDCGRYGTVKYMIAKR